MTNEGIRINPETITIDSAGRVIMEDPALAKAIVMAKDLNMEGEVSCNLGCIPIEIPIPPINFKCAKFENIAVSDKFKVDFVDFVDIGPIKDLNAVREHIFSNIDTRGGTIIDRPDRLS